MKRKLSDPLVVFLLAMVCSLLWGSAFPALKLGYLWFDIGASDTVSQIMFAGMRFALAGIMTIMIASALNKKIAVPKKENWGITIVFSFVQTIILYVFYYIGLAHTTGVKASIIESSNVFISILLVSLVFGYEKLTWNKVLGCILGLGGVVMINLGGKSISGFSFLGEGFCFIAACSYALSSIVIKKYSNREDPIILSGYQLLIGGSFMAVVGFALGGKIIIVNDYSILLLVYLAFLSAAAFAIWYLLLKNNPVSSVTIYGFAKPVFGVILSAVILKEGAQMSIGLCVVSLVLVSLGIILVNKNFKRQ